MSKTGTFHLIWGLDRAVPNFIFDRFWRFRKCFWVIFRVLCENLKKKKHVPQLLNPSFLFDLFYMVTWDDLDLYYGHKIHEMILTDVSDTIHADSLALFALNIDILLADVTKPKKSIFLFDLTCDVISDLQVQLFTLQGSSRTALSNGVWNLEIAPVVWEISGRSFPPPPQQDVLRTSGSRVNDHTGQSTAKKDLTREYVFLRILIPLIPNLVTVWRYRTRFLIGAITY